MNVLNAPYWSTSCFGDAPAASTPELTALDQHLRHCNAPHRALFRLRCAAEALNGFASARFMTSLALLALPVLVLSLFL